MRAVGLALALCCSLAFAEADKAPPAPIFLPRDEEIELALSAGPDHIRADATVYTLGAAGYEKVRAGTNGFTCLVNRDGNQNGDEDLKATCWDAEGSATIVPVMLRVGELITQHKSADEIRRDINAGFSDHRFISPRKVGVAYMLRGDLRIDRKTKRLDRIFPPHYMIYAPGLTNDDLGLKHRSDIGRGTYALPHVYSGYSGGAHTSYLMVFAIDVKTLEEQKPRFPTPAPASPTATPPPMNH